MSQNHILTTHVGSLIRPPELLAQMEVRQEGKSVDDGIFVDTIGYSVAEVVRPQAETGIDVVSDGEFGKTGSWSRCVVERLGGTIRRMLWPQSLKDHHDFEEFYVEYEHGAAALGKSIVPAGAPTAALHKGHSDGGYIHQSCGQAACAQRGRSHRELSAPDGVAA